jgi:hypothetical protein
MKMEFASIGHVERIRRELLKSVEDVNIDQMETKIQVFAIDKKLKSDNKTTDTL